MKNFGGQSLGELIEELKKIRGKLPKTEFSEYDKPFDRLMNLISAPDHEFKPDIVVTDSGKTVAVNGFLYSIKADAGFAECKLNFDREISDEEFTVVFPGVVKVVSRLAENVYLKAPTGQTSKVTLEALKLT